MVLSPLSAAVAVDGRRQGFVELETCETNGAKGAHGTISTATANAHREKHCVVAMEPRRTCAMLSSQLTLAHEPE